jgi:hypothetical protein
LIGKNESTDRAGQWAERRRDDEVVGIVFGQTGISGQRLGEVGSYQREQSR